MRFLCGLLILCFTAAAVWASGFLTWQLGSIEFTVTENPEPALVTVKRGDSAGTVIREMFGDRFDSRVLRLWLKQNPGLTKLKAGTYEIPPGCGVREALAIIISGKEKSYQITLVEGTRVSDILMVLRGAEKLKHELPQDAKPEDLPEILGMPDHPNPEGLFLADTYQFRLGDSDVSVLKRAYEASQKFLEQEWQRRDKDLPYASPYEALIMASIIEKESAVSAERPQIASVFVNRLRKGMKLQTDPTVIYGVRDRYQGKIYRSFLEDKNPYNTYIIEGLPPTPIAAPGKDAIKAALHPDATEYLFFVARGPDSREGHVFSKDDRSHCKAVSDYRKAVREYKNDHAAEIRAASEKNAAKQDAGSPEPADAGAGDGSGANETRTPGDNGAAEEVRDGNGKDGKGSD